MSNMPTEKWFVAQLRPQGLLRAQENLGRQAVQSFCPKRPENLMRGGKQRMKLSPLFPGYLFVRVDTESPSWTALNATRGISRIILSDPRAPRALPAPFMAGLLARCDAQGVISAPSDMRPGDRIRILAGPFAETIAQIETLETDDRVSILLSLMGREVRTFIVTRQVEKL